MATNQTREANITIEDFEDKKWEANGKSGRYTRFKTSEGWISSFEKELIPKLKDMEGKRIRVEITTANDKEKITKFIAVATENDMTEAKREVQPTTRQAEVKGNPKLEYVKLAVEIFAHREDVKTIVDAVQIVKATEELF